MTSDLGDGDDDAQPPRSSSSAEQALRKECGFSQVLVDDLKAHRHQITRAHLAGNFAVAFDLVLYTLCADLFRGFGYRKGAFPQLPVMVQGIDCSLNISKGFSPLYW